MMMMMMMTMNNNNHHHHRRRRRHHHGRALVRAQTSANAAQSAKHCTSLFCGVGYKILTILIVQKF